MTTFPTRHREYKSFTTASDIEDPSAYSVTSFSQKRALIERALTRVHRVLQCARHSSSKPPLVSNFPSSPDRAGNSHCPALPGACLAVRRLHEVHLAHTPHSQTVQPLMPSTGS